MVSLLLGAALLTGCGNGNGSAEETGQTSSANEESSQTGAAEASATPPAGDGAETDGAPRTSARTATTPAELRLTAETVRMMGAVMTNDLDTVRTYLEEGGEPDLRGHRDESLLHTAARAGHVEMARLLLNHGAEVMIRSNTDVTPLHWAARFGHLEVCRLLIEHGADVNALAGVHRDQTPLALAATRQYREVVEYLGSVGGHP